MANNRLKLRNSKRSMSYINSNPLTSSSPEKSNWHNKLGSFAMSAANVIAAVLLGCVLIANIVVTTKVSLDGEEFVSYHITFWYLLALPIFMLLLVVFLKIIKNLDAKLLYVGFACIYILIGVYFIVHTMPFIWADSKSVWEAAEQMTNGDFLPLLKENYLGMFPYQLGLTTYDILIRLIGSDERIIYAVNLLEVLVINWFGYKITHKLFDNDMTDKIAITLEFAFLPQFYFILFGYGLIHGFCYMMIAVYFFVCACRKEGGIKSKLLMILFATIATILKPNYAIGAMAMGITLAVIGFKSSDTKAMLKNILTAILLVAIPLASPSALKAVYSNISGMEIGEGVPMISNIAMGTDIDNEMRGPGWFDGSTYEDYPACGNDSDATAEFEKAKLKNNWVKICESPAKAARFFIKKIMSTWCDPMFQSVWSGPVGIDEGSVRVTTRALKSLYSGGKAEKASSILSKCECIVIVACVIYYILKMLRTQNHPETLAFHLYFVGGFIFHFFSETKSQYVYMYIFLMIPLCACVLAKSALRVKTAVKR